MSESNRVLSMWGRLSGRPGGKWLFSRVICWTAPYFGSIRPRFQVMEPGHSVVTMKKRRAVTNHIRTVHAIAMCNLAEIAAGTMTEATVPRAFRWIPKGMTVEYLRKAETDLRAVAKIEPIPDFSGSFALPVEVDVVDSHQETVFRAVIDMWVSPRKRN
jgi:acyl-coenzyme A thioesterase PaaI-like protein